MTPEEMNEMWQRVNERLDLTRVVMGDIAARWHGIARAVGLGPAAPADDTIDAEIVEVEEE